MTRTIRSLISAPFFTSPRSGNLRSPTTEPHGAKWCGFPQLPDGPPSFLSPHCLCGTRREPSLRMELARGQIVSLFLLKPNHVPLGTNQSKMDDGLHGSFFSNRPTHNVPYQTSF